MKKETKQNKECSHKWGEIKEMLEKHLDFQNRNNTLFYY